MSANTASWFPKTSLFQSAKKSLEDALTWYILHGGIFWDILSFGTLDTSGILFCKVQKYEEKWLRNMEYHVRTSLEVFYRSLAFESFHHQESWWWNILIQDMSQLWSSCFGQVRSCRTIQQDPWEIFAFHQCKEQYTWYI